MGLTLAGVAQLVLAAVAVAGAVTSWVLGKRGARTAETEQAAKQQLEEHMEAFHQVESLNDRLSKELDRTTRDVDRLRADLETMQDVAGQRLAEQGRRCRARLDDLTATLSALQGVVLSEIAKASAGDAIEGAMRHVATDHPEEEES